MIRLPCSVARTCRAVFKRLPMGRSPRGKPLVVGLRAGPEGLRLRGATEGIAAEYLHRASAEELNLVVPLDALSEIEGRSGEATLTPEGDGVLVRWTKSGAAQERTYSLIRSDVPDLPPWPEEGVVANRVELLSALDRACKVAATESVRFALQRLLLRGKQGEVVATDGKQLLVEGGYAFPWREDLLVYRSGVFGTPELQQHESVQVARAAEHVLLRCGDWTLALQVAQGERYPNVDTVLPSPRPAATIWHLGAEEAPGLVRSLAELPGAREDLAPVTIDLGRSVHLRAREGKGRPVEVTLADSTTEGKSVRIATNRHYLTRACELGFRSFAVAEGKPVVCRDGKRLYLWATLDAKDVVPPQPFSVHVPLPTESSAEAAEVPGSRAMPKREAPAQPSVAPRLRVRAARRPVGLLGLLPLWAAQCRSLADLVREQRRKEGCS